MPAEQRGQVIHVKMESTGNRRNSCLGGSPAGLPWGGTSRMRREFHVRICEGLGVKFPGPTRRNQKPSSRTGLLPSSPLRTVHESFPSHSSSPSNASFRETRFRDRNALAVNPVMALGMK